MVSGWKFSGTRLPYTTNSTQASQNGQSRVGCTGVAAEPLMSICQEPARGADVGCAGRRAEVGGTGGIGKGQLRCGGGPARPVPAGWFKPQGAAV